MAELHAGEVSLTLPFYYLIKRWMDGWQPSVRAKHLSEAMWFHEMPLISDHELHTTKISSAGAFFQNSGHWTDSMECHDGAIFSGVLRILESGIVLVVAMCKAEMAVISTHGVGSKLSVRY
jgi:hypothetical protein